MSQKKAHLTSIVVFAVAAFFVGLVAGVNYGRSIAEPLAVPAGAHADPQENGDGKDPAPGDQSQNSGEKEKYSHAPDFALVELETGETVELADFADSHLVLFVSTTT